jgi:hypothetical protein
MEGKQRASCVDAIHQMSKRRNFLLSLQRASLTSARGAKTELSSVLWGQRADLSKYKLQVHSKLTVGRDFLRHVEGHWWRNFQSNVCAVEEKKQ